MRYQLVKGLPGCSRFGSIGVSWYGALTRSGHIDHMPTFISDTSTIDASPVRSRLNRAVEIAPGYEMQVRPRSGLAVRFGVTVLNAPGTIDSDYRGPLGVLLVNFAAAAYTVSHGERIAQLIVAPVVRARFEAVEELVASGRGTGGFGSTGRL